MDYTASLWPASFKFKDLSLWSQEHRHWAIWTKLHGLVPSLHCLPPFQFYAWGPKLEIAIILLIQNRFRLGKIGLKCKPNSFVFRIHTDRNQAGKGTWGRQRGLWTCKGHPLLTPLILELNATVKQGPAVHSKSGKESVQVETWARVVSLVLTAFHSTP